MEHLTGADVAADRLGQRGEEEHHLAHPVGHQHAVEFDALGMLSASSGTTYFKQSCRPAAAATAAVEDTSLFSLRSLVRAGVLTGVHALRIFTPSSTLGAKP